MEKGKITLNLVQEQVFDNRKLEEYTKSLRSKYQLNNKILLIQSPQFLFETLNIEVAKNRGCYAFPPNGLQCIAKMVSNENFEIQYLDVNFEVLKKLIYEENYDYTKWLDIMDEKIKEYDPSIIGVTCLTANGDVLRPSHPLTAMLHRLKSEDKRVIIAGGPTPTSEHEDYIRTGLCHFVVSKEGEDKINYLLDSLFNEKPSIESTNGIFFKYEGMIEESQGKVGTLDMKGNLVRTYDSIPIEHYKDIGSLNPFSRMMGQETIYATFQFNRGCKANCKFCDVSKFMGQGTRHYPVDELIEELTYLVEKRNVRHLEVLDDDFIGNQKGVVELLKKMVPLHEKYGMTWAANNGLIAASINEEIMDLMDKSGCMGYKIGIESGNADMLIKIRKPATIPLLLKRRPLLTKYPKIFVGGYYIIGLFEEETFSQMMDTFRFCIQMDLDWSSISTFQVTSKETALIENFKSKGGTASDFVPAKDYSKREITETENLLSGKDIFSTDPNSIPSHAQIKQIWFTFNIVVNYIYNKNFMPGGNPKKIGSWLKSLQYAYPQNPFMPMFESFCHMLSDNTEEAQNCMRKTKDIITNSEYWIHRFDQFGMNKVFDRYPQSKEEVYQFMDELRGQYAKWIVK